MNAWVGWMFGVCAPGRGGGGVVHAAPNQIVPVCNMLAGSLGRPPLHVQIRVAVEIVRDTRLAAHPAESKLQHGCLPP
jgi:hypothetical protein